MTTEQVARQVLRSYLVRCHRFISEEYPKIANMTPEQSADYLLQLQDTGRISILLNNESNHFIGCKIIDLSE
ncbi:MAG: hypothetical protein ACO1RT_18045 [Planctomycetaceae bacterium]